MFSRTSATLFNGINRIQKRGYIDELKEISDICHNITVGNIPLANKRIREFSKESGPTYYNMLWRVVDTAEKCNQLDLATEVKDLVSKHCDESKLESDQYFSNNY